MVFMTRPERGTLAYVVKSFPAVSTTFVVNEIWSLRQRGWSVRILAAERASAAVVHARAAALLPMASYAGGVFSWACLKAHLYFMFRYPLRYLDVFLDTLFVRFFPYHISELILFFKAVQLAWKIRAEDVRHIHAHFAAGNASCAMIIARLLDKEFSFTGHAVDLFVFEKPRELRDKIRRAKFVVTISEYNKRYMLDKSRSGSREKIHVLPNSIFPEDFRGKTYEGTDVPALLTICRFVEKKGLPHLVAAYSILRKRGVPFRALIIGEGPQKGLLDELIRVEGLGEVVHVFPFERQDVIKGRYQEAEVFVLPCVRVPSGDQDGVPYVLVEAMACGLPVVSTYLSGIPELIRNGETGFLVEPADSRALADVLQALLRDDALRKSVGEAARKHILADHDLTKNIGRLEDLIRPRGAVPR